MTKLRCETAADCNAAIGEIFLTRSVLAADSEYDRSVCIRAVSVARELFNTIPVSEPAENYVESVIDTLSQLVETYHDSEGVFTSGKSSIGDILSDLWALRAGSSGEATEGDLRQQPGLLKPT